MDKGTRRPGPRPKGPFEDKRATLTTRITQETRDKLDASAVAAGRSLSQEIEFRLESSFAADEVFGGARAAALFRMLAGAAKDIEARLGSGGWLEDFATFAVVRQRWVELIDEHGPKE
ncbi:MAG TPA: hypothetical protein VKU84_07695, partial [Stellaceae bacterium]|nr:hypothetical protein [Stellaceae bacterium]